MWEINRAFYIFSALVLFSLLSLLSAHGQDTDTTVVQNQEKIISTVLSLNESLTIRENIFKLDRQNWMDEKNAWQIEKETLQKQIESFRQTETDMLKLKDSLEKQSAQLTREQRISKIKTVAIITTVSVCLVEGFIIWIK